MHFIMNIILYFVKTQESRQPSLFYKDKFTTIRWKNFMGKYYILSSTVHDEKKRFRKIK